MNRFKRLALVVGAIAVVGGAAAFAAQEIELPEFLKADEQVPVKEPESYQKVAVLQVALTSSEGRVEGKLLSQEVIARAAPKVVARSGGEWEVRVIGKTRLEYRIPNPLLDIETENPGDDRNPYSSVDVDSYDWTLIVPLYRGEESLGAETIEVVDVATGNTILSTPVRG